MSFRCYDNSDVIATLIIINFHLYLIHLWWQFFQIFVFGDVVYAQTWEVLTLKNCIEPPYQNGAGLKTKSLLFCLKYDPLIVFRRQNHITFIFLKTMSRPLSANGLSSLVCSEQYCLYNRFYCSVGIRVF